MSSGPTQSGRPVVYGEVLFDRFPAGESVLGGAPFNVAWHLAGFGLDPLFISRVGTDPAGQQVVAAMQAWNMDLRGLQQDPDHPTGAVQVSLDDGQPAFDILADQAYDHISAESFPVLLQGQVFSLLYAGSLASRSPESRATLDHLQRQTRAPLFVDVNLRPPWWERPRLEGALTRARWAKLNDDELAEIAGTATPADELLRRAEVIRTRFDLDLLVLTRGAAGAALVGRGMTEEAAPQPVEELVDTVGAGDAFSAVTILGLTAEWPAETILARALSFAARICQQRGATAADPALYDEYRGRWQL